MLRELPVAIASRSSWVNHRSASTYTPNLRSRASLATRRRAIPRIREASAKLYRGAPSIRLGKIILIGVTGSCTLTVFYAMLKEKYTSVLWHGILLPAPSGDPAYKGVEIAYSSVP